MNDAPRPMVIAANWKMHKTVDDVAPYFQAFDREAPAAAPDVELVFFPPHPILQAVAEALAPRADASAGGQSCHWEQEGAWTGEVSPRMIAATGATRVLIGHSERRTHFGETDETCARKLRAAFAEGLSPMLCVGETLEQRQAGQARSIVLSQLSNVVDDLSRAEYRRLAIAYEPVWAIGTGETAEPDDAQEMHEAIRGALAQIATPELAAEIPVLYGGSVKSGNAAELLGRSDIDGALVGGASLEPAEFAAILSAGQATRRGSP
ncbi:MAG: triose-phosphate isomerase [Gemmatimonadota bacterium]|nr:triose-phosphate isomerase [Gemmatimonadota bacterium]